MKKLFIMLIAVLFCTMTIGCSRTPVPKPSVNTEFSTKMTELKMQFNRDNLSIQQNFATIMDINVDSTGVDFVMTKDCGMAIVTSELFSAGKQIGTVYLVYLSIQEKWRLVQVLPGKPQKEQKK
jgi:hypothetical protein